MTTKHQQIEKLLEKGLKPKEIAQRLGTNVNYVYTVRKNMREATKEWDKIKVVSVEVMPDLNFWQRLVYLFKGHV